MYIKTVQPPPPHRPDLYPLYKAEPYTAGNEEGGRLTPPHNNNNSNNNIISSIAPVSLNNI